MTNHLGGHLNTTHTDSGALKLLRKVYGVRTLLDVGCGPGGQIREAMAIGIEAFGIEGDESLRKDMPDELLERITFADLTKGPVLLDDKVDAVWCVEVAEHIEEKYCDNLLETLSRNLCPYGLLVFTASQSPHGYHHVNLKPMSWWIAKLAEYCLIHNEALTSALHSASTMRRDFIKTTGIVCIKQEVA